MRTAETIKTIAIIGGGVSGTLTALQLIHQGVVARVVIIDPHPELGLGLAYSTPSFRHLLNVPAGKISALPDQPHHFLLWLRQNYDPSATPFTFAPRAVFGRYIQSLATRLDKVEHRQASVVNYTALPSGAILELDNHQTLHADYVVLATGNFDPAPLPGISQQAAALRLYAHNAWLAETYEGIGIQDPVILIGTGLTAVDVVLRLRETGHRGTITAISRHGIFPQRHDNYEALSQTAIPENTPASCLAYLRALRSTIGSGVSWRAAIDSLRSSTNALWLALPLKEQHRFRRHLQRRWDVLRHRMAPPIADSIDAELQAGALRVAKGRILSVDTMGGRAIVTARTRGGIQEITGARVINCTGPSMNYRHIRSGLFRSLFERGIVSEGPLGSGFNTSPDGAMIDAQGRVSKTLFNIGPGRLGTLLESIAVPEIREQAHALAELISRHLMQQAPVHEPLTYQLSDRNIA